MEINKDTGEMPNQLIFKKLPLVMAEIGAIGKDRKNTQQGYSFRGIDDIYNAVNSALSKHGVFCIPHLEQMVREERPSKSGGVLIYTMLYMLYTFYAEDGSSLQTRLIGEAMDSGDKGCNKAMSAAQKYAFLQIFCIPTEDLKDTENETHEIGTHAQTSKPSVTAPKPKTEAKGPAETSEVWDVDRVCGVLVAADSKETLHNLWKTLMPKMSKLSGEEKLACQLVKDNRGKALET